MYEINEKLLRKALKSNTVTDDYPYTVAKEYKFTDCYGIDNYNFIQVYIKPRSIIVSKSWNIGYKKYKRLLNTYKRTTDKSQLYADIAELIENQEEPSCK